MKAHHKLGVSSLIEVLHSAETYFHGAPITDGEAFYRDIYKICSNGILKAASSAEDKDEGKFHAITMYTLAKLGEVSIIASQSNLSEDETKQPPLPTVANTPIEAASALQQLTPPFLVVTYRDGREYNGDGADGAAGHAWSVPDRNAFTSGVTEHLVELNEFANHFYASEMRLADA